MRTMLASRLSAAALALCVTAGAALPAVPALASRHSERNWRYLTYGAGAATAYGAVTHRPTVALLGAAGTAYSYSRWRKDVRNRHRHARRYRYHRVYRYR